MWTKYAEITDLVTFTEEILNGKFSFFVQCVCLSDVFDIIPFHVLQIPPCIDSGVLMNLPNIYNGAFLQK